MESTTIKIKLIEMLVAPPFDYDEIHRWFLDNDCEHYFSRPWGIPDNVNRRVIVHAVYGIYEGYEDVAMKFMLTFSAKLLDKPYIYADKK
jgi:hypothetical protein